MAGKDAEVRRHTFLQHPSLPSLPISVRGPKRVKNKTKAERIGPRKRNRKKCRPAGSAAATTFVSVKEGAKSVTNIEMSASTTGKLWNVFAEFFPEPKHFLPKGGRKSKQFTESLTLSSYAEPIVPPCSAREDNHHFMWEEPTTLQSVTEAHRSPERGGRKIPLLQHGQTQNKQTSVSSGMERGVSVSSDLSTWSSASIPFAKSAMDELHLARLNRKWWTSYVIAAADVERVRRIDEEHEEEQRERRERQEWALRAMEAEQARIIEEYRKNQDADTVKTTKHVDDYIVVCPNCARGCEYEGPLHDITRHLMQCEYVGRENALEQNVGAANEKSEEYVIMCPFAYFGCNHCCVKDELEDHMKVCRFRGSTREEEEADRQNAILDVIVAAEEEQQRRVEALGMIQAIPTPLQQIMETQTEMLQRQIGEELRSFTSDCWRVMELRRGQYETIIASIGNILSTTAPGVIAVPYGSYVTGLALPQSDLDLVLVEESTDDHVRNLQNDGILQRLAERLQTETWVGALKIIITAVVPVIKFVASLPLTSGELCVVPVDITVRSNDHTGIAGVGFVKTMAKNIPHIIPVTLFLKKCLRERELGDPFSGGLASYGIFLLVTSVALRHASLPGFGVGDDLMDKSVESLWEKKVICENVHGMEYGSDIADAFCQVLLTDTQRNSSPLTYRRKRSISSGSNGEMDLAHDGAPISERDPIRLGRLFMHVLHFLGHGFEPEVDNVSLIYSDTTKTDDMDPMILDDPLSPGNNVGRRCYRISEIQKLCSDALTELYSILIRGKKHTSSKKLSSSKAIDLNESGINSSPKVLEAVFLKNKPST
jgi:hypothetical protein